MHKITFPEKSITIEIEADKTILDAQIGAGLSPDAFCGGKGTCGKCKVMIDGEIRLACRQKADRDYIVYLNHSEEASHILTSGSGKSYSFDPAPLPTEVDSPLLAAIDVGSTSVVAYLMDGKSGAELALKSSLNPQRQFGADVVARCSYAMEHDPAALSSCIRQTVNDLLKAMTEETKRSTEDILRIVFVGNSCMHHLFLEIPTDTLALAPYTPRVTESLTLRAAEYGINIHPNGEMVWLANIGGFVGADTVGCLVAADMEKQAKMTLMIDIGTNGEMVLGNQDGLLACSTAAGPAFEGAKITCGMRGADGAIDKVYIENGELRYHVIGDCRAAGICGSGLLDAAACLLKLGLIDETGRMDETYYFTDTVFLNQKDIRELQLAKAAIAAGIAILCREKGIKISDIERLLIAGAFGNYLDPDSACAIGMLPMEIRDRIESIGNAAGEGARIAVLNQAEYERSKTLARTTEFLELALDPGFQDVYVDEIFFPENE